MIADRMISYVYASILRKVLSIAFFALDNVFSPQPVDLCLLFNTYSRRMLITSSQLLKKGVGAQKKRVRQRVCVRTDS